MRVIDGEGASRDFAPLGDPYEGHDVHLSRHRLLVPVERGLGIDIVTYDLHHGTGLGTLLFGECRQAVRSTRLGLLVNTRTELTHVVTQGPGWTFPTERLVGTTESTVLVETAASVGIGLAALDLDTGEVRWRLSLPEARDVNLLGAGDGALVLGIEKWASYAWDGRERGVHAIKSGRCWIRDYDGHRLPPRWRPGVAGNRDVLQVVDAADGSTRFRHEPGGYAAVVSAGRVLVLQCQRMDDRLVTRLSTFEHPEVRLASTRYVDGHLADLTSSGTKRVFALAVADRSDGWSEPSNVDLPSAGHRLVAIDW